MNRLSVEEREILDYFRENRVLEAYRETFAKVCKMTSQKPPKDIEKAFLGYLRGMVPYGKKILPEIHWQLIEELGGEITYFQANAIVMILSDGEIRRFVPLQTIQATEKRLTVPRLTEENITSKTPITQWEDGKVPKSNHAVLKSFPKTVRTVAQETSSIWIGNNVPVKLGTEVVNPPFDLEKARFTVHALDRFTERFPEHVQGDPKKGALALLAQAHEDKAISKVGTVKRIIDNKFREARYFKTGRCRFVVMEENGFFEVLTVEHAYLR